MKKISKGILSFVIILFLILQMIPKFTFAETDASSELDDTTKIELSIFTELKNEDNSAKVAFYTGEDVPAFADVSISGNGTVIKNPKVKLTLPKELVENNPIFTKSATATSWEKTQDATNWYVTYHFDQMVGGQSVTLPFIFRWKQPITPNGFTTTPKLELFDEHDQILKTATTTFVAKIYPMKPMKMVRYGDTNYGSMSGDHWKPYETIDGHKVKTSTISGLQENELTYTKTGADAPYVDYDIGISPTEKSAYGKYAPTSVKIVDKLPEGAQMSGEKQEDGFYHYRFDDQTYKWQYDKNTHTATYVGPVNQNKRLVTIRLIYPNQPYNKVFENKAVITLNPDTANAQDLEEQSAYIKWKPLKAVQPTATGENHFDKDPSKRDPGYAFTARTDSFADGPWFSIAVWNRNNGISDANGIHSMMVKELSDYELDSRLFYNKIYLSRGTTNNKILEKGYKVYGVKQDDSEVLLGENMPAEQRLDINDQAGQYKKLVIRMNEPIEVSQNLIKFVVETPVKPSVWAKWQQNPTSQDEGGIFTPRLMYNTANVTYYDTYDTTKKTKTYESKDYTQYRLEDMKVGSYNGSNYTVAYGDDNTRSLYGEAKVMGDLAAISEKNPASNYTLHNVKHITLLPTGINYVPNTGRVWRANTNKTTNQEPTVVHNFRNTGRTAVIFDFGDVERTNDYYKDVRADFKVDVTLYAHDGDNTVEHFLTWDNNDTITRGGQHKVNYIDALDLDDDKDTNETFLRGTNNIRFIPPREVILRKYVSLDKEGWTLDGPLQDLGEHVYYKLNILNNSLRPLTVAHILDALPYKNDHSIAPNNEGQYLPRESLFTVSLNEFLEDMEENREVLKKWNVFYSTTAQQATLGETRDVPFMTKDSIANIRDVKLIKIVLKDGAELRAKEEANFIISGKLPFDKTLEINDSAKNSAAVSTNAFDYIEGNKVTIPVVKYEVNGVVFTDVDKDTLLKDVDVKLPNYTLQLMNQDGTPYLDENNQSVTTTTNAQGAYHFDVYKRGEYYVKITKKAVEEEFTGINENKKLVGNDGTQDDTQALEGKTASFELNPRNLTATKNFGLISTKGIIVVRKVNEDLEPVADVTFELRKENTVIRTATTNASGTLHFTDLDFGEYQIVEKETQAMYVLDATAHNVTLTKAEANVTLAVTNNYKRGVISFVKKDADTQAPLAGVQFELRKDDIVVQTSTSGQDGVVRFSDVKYGDYTIVEKQTLASHKLDTTVRQVTVNNAEISFNEGVVFNTVKKGTIRLQKVGVQKTTLTGTPKKAPLENVVFVLKQNGVIKHEGSTNAEGTLEFTNVAYGTYDLEEKATQAGYVKKEGVLQTVTIAEDEAVINVGEITNNQISGNLKVVKVDAENPETKLSNVSFKLYDSNNTLIKTAATNANGEVIFENLPYGEYQLEETAPATGYVLATEKIPVSITEDGTTVSKTITNQKIKGSIKILKIDEDDKNKEEKTGLDGVGFELFSIEKASVVATGVTDSKGELLLEGLPYGNYKVRETKTKEGYLLNTKETAVSIRDQGKIVPLTITNVKKKGNIKVIKKDAEDQTLIGGAQFDLKQNENIIASKMTNSSGEIIFENVPYGTYTLVEKEASDGYVLNATPVEVEIRENGTVVTKEITNTKIKANVKVIKMDADDNALLEGVHFELRKGETKIKEGITNSEGVVIFENVPYGVYDIIETQAKEGYMVTEDPLEAVVYQDGVEVTVTATNKKIKGNIKVVKKDTHGLEKLSGVKFELRKGDTKVQDGITNSDGEILFTDVLYGTYEVVETQAKEGYVLNKQPQTVNVQQNGITLTKKFTNDKIKGSIKVIKKDVDDGSEIANVRFDLIQNGTTVASQRTNSDGIVIFGDVDYGTYSLVEKEAGDGYVLNATPVEVVIHQNGEVVTKEITNTKIKANVKVIKMDADDNALLEGVHFELRKGETKIKEGITNSEGVVIFENVPYGVYDIIETQAKEGYMVTEDPLEAVVYQDGVEVIVTATNKKIKGSIKVIKKDAEDNTLLERTQFDLKQNENIIASKMTNPSGEIIFENVPYGTYTLVEKEASDGYVLNTTPVEVAVRDNGTVVTKEITNKKIKGNIKVTKKDADDNTPLAGVHFALRKGETKVQEGITNENGELVFENIAYGVYEVVETQPKEGYVLNENPLEAVIYQDGVEVGVTATNTKIKGSIKVVKKDAADNTLLAGVHFELRKGKEKIQEGITDANGEITFNDVVYGTYQLVETQAKEGYVSNVQSEEVAIRQNGEVITKEITNAKIKGSIKVIKKDVDDGAKLADVRFDLIQNGTIVASQRTNSEGIVVFSDVEYGTYSLVEKEAKNGYVLNATPIEVEIRENETVVTKEITNTKIKGNVKVIKTDAEDSSKLEGVQFELRQDGKVVQTETTAANGEITFKDVVFGTYQLVETKAKEGYVLNTEPQEVVINENGAVITKEITNTKIKGNVKVIKIDTEDSSKLGGVQFELRKDGKVVRTETTDANGEITFKDVVFGTYSLVETKAKEGYVLNTEPKEVVINENGAVITKEITNAKIKGSIKVIKTDAEDRSKLEGVQFELRKEGKVVQTETTDANGEITFKDVVFGTYSLVEKEAKNGYVLNTEPQEVVINENGAIITKEITNTKIKGNVKVVKTDAEDSSKLEGVQFELRKDGKVVQTETTDANGEITFKDVVFGTYSLVETKAKEGYVLNTEPQEVVVSEDGKTIEKTITNKKQPVTPETPKVEEPKRTPKLKEKVDTNDNTSMGTMMLLFMSGALLMYQRKKQR